MLTTRENQILEIIATTGATNAEVAGTLGCTEKTVKVHLSSMFVKMDVSNRVRMVLKFHGLLKA